MGKSGKKIENCENSAKKRDRISSEELSPSVIQESKLSRMAGKEDLKDLINSVSLISNKMSKLDLLETMDGEIKKIVKSHEELKVSLLGVVSRVDNVEREVKNMKESGDATVCELKKKINMLEQAEIGNTLLIKNLPANLYKDTIIRREALKKIFDALGLDEGAIFYNFDASLSNDGKQTVFRLTFLSSLIKNDIVRTYRNVKKNENCNTKLLVENITQLPTDSPLNGTYIMIVNKLTPHYTHLIKHARSFVGSHFDFVCDSPEGNILVRCLGKFVRIHTEDDVKRLIQDVVNKGEVKSKPARMKTQNQGQPGGQMRTRLQSQKENN